jgi:hypothetical protein
MFTKPCLRAADGCQGLVKDSRPSRLLRRKFCCSWCSNRYQVERGIHPLQHKSIAQRRASGRKGGKVGAETRRKAAVLTAVKQIETLLPEELLGKLTNQEQARLRLLMGLAWQRGHKVGMSCERTRRVRVEEARAQGLKPKRRQLAMDQAFLEQSAILECA